MTCMCGDTHCPSCGPAQGNSRCPICKAWADDGCEHWTDEGEIKPEFEEQLKEIMEAEMENDKELADYLEIFPEEAF